MNVLNRKLQGITLAMLFFMATLKVGRVQAAGGDGDGPPSCCCYYHMWTCTYNDSSYWDGCDPKWDEGEIWTWLAEGRCGAYHPNG